ncbi:hypothetical protein [Staphylococcus aureus]|nr:hypothetical protein [Staphylococcus aureus]AUG72896.1 hypothetical protein SAO46_00425 [Staphylococcus aureus O46]HDG5468375.1 hypothetical protein [Staphylococcus aureus]HDG5486553.1 hypothetical protein [Staphylococcus aureus]HDJ2726195.1 hypothetical protein [Staphylococcus aureus]HDP5793285.1 hypothetical protein [Staphylococcus aureus]
MLVKVAFLCLESDETSNVPSVESHQNHFYLTNIMDFLINLTMIQI